MTGILHATDPSGGDYTLCGQGSDAADGDDPFDYTQPFPDFAGPGELVTCPHCRRVIDEIKTIKRYRYPKTTDANRQDSSDA